MVQPVVQLTNLLRTNPQLVVLHVVQVTNLQRKNLLLAVQHVVQVTKKRNQPLAEQLAVQVKSNPTHPNGLLCIPVAYN